MDIQGIIFDMDGTLTVPILDFKRIRQELGVTDRDADLVEVINRRSEPEQREAWAVIERHEEEAVANCCFQPDLDPVLNRFASAGIRLAVITRNTRRSADIVLGRLSVRFDPILTREFPFLKPSPEPVRHILTQWRLEPRNVLMVGDYVHDIESGRAAGVYTCYYHEPSLRDAWSGEADFTVSSYEELSARIL